MHFKFGLTIILWMTISVSNRFQMDFNNIQGSKEDTMGSSYELLSSNACWF